LDALFNELFEAVVVTFLTELLEDAVFTEIFVANFATTLLREPPLLTCFDLEEALDAWTFGRLDVDDFAVFSFGGAAVFTSPGLSIAVISELCKAAGDALLLVDLDSDPPRSASASPRTSRAFAWNKVRLASTVEVESVQTFAPSFQSMPALPQSALVSGWLEVSKRRGSATSPIDSAARPVLSSLG
jgi:hypothetical protein